MLGATEFLQFGGEPANILDPVFIGNHDGVASIDDDEVFDAERGNESTVAPNIGVDGVDGEYVAAQDIP